LLPAFSHLSLVFPYASILLLGFLLPAFSHLLLVFPYASILLLDFLLAFSRLSLVLLSAFSRLSLILLVGFHRSIKKGSAIEKPYNRDYLTSIDYKQAIT
jgi:hypothetical protein